MFGIRSKRLWTGLAAVSLLALAACSSQGGAQNSGGARPREGKRLTIAMVTHGAASDAFWSQIQTGAKEAAAKDNVDFRYSGSGQVPEQATFIQNAIDSKVDGIAVTLPTPPRSAPVVQKARTPASRSWPSTPATATGRSTARCPSSASPRPSPASSSAPSSTSSAPSTPSASPTPRARSSSRTAARAPNRSSPARPRTSSPTAPTSRTYVSTVSSKLRQDPSIDSVITLDASFAVAVQKQLEQDGSKAKIVTYAFNSDLIPLLQNGKVAFTIDQQPYLQGYMAVDSLWLYNRNKGVLGAQQPIATGPVVVDQSNIGDSPSTSPKASAEGSAGPPTWRGEEDRAQPGGSRQARDGKHRPDRLRPDRRCPCRRSSDDLW